MPRVPLDHLDELLPPHVREVVDRETPIPSIAQRAASLTAKHPHLVRADIGQISSFEPDSEVLYGPPVGLPVLRSLVAETWNKTFGLEDAGLAGAESGLRSENVAICTGAAEGLSLLFRCFAQDKVVGLPRGHWENYANGISLAQGRATMIDYFDSEGQLDLAGIEKQIEAEKVSLLVINFPCNPTGAVLDRGDYEKLAELIKTRELMVISDEVYARLRYDGQPPQTLLSFAPGNVVCVSSASKEFLLPGARVGYVISAQSGLTDRVLRKLIRANTASPNVLGQRRLAEIMRSDLDDLESGDEPAFIAKVRDEMSARRDLLVEVLAKHGMECVGRVGHKPSGTIFLMASLPSWWKGDDAGFVEEALSRGLFSAIPGTAFGMPQTVRFSFGGMDGESIRYLDAGLSTFEKGLA